jgi:hypothetical protein
MTWNMQYKQLSAIRPTKPTANMKNAELSGWLCPVFVLLARIFAVATEAERWIAARRSGELLSDMVKAEK